jgi:UDP-N-acetylglucosamine 2-epimerase (non-hydrolysing)
MKILTILGTRPEAIKLAPIIKELEKHPEDVISKVCVTAQHREMLDQVLTLFDISPEYDLDIMQPNQRLHQITASVFTKLTPVIETEQPDWLLVQGDTTTVLAASLAAFYLGVKVGHVEAGLRTWNKKQPFPEEINRRVAGVVADLHFAPTSWAMNNLLAENIPAEQIVVTGNSVIDALLMAAKVAYNYEKGPLADLPWNKQLILVTAHRRENFGAPLKNICQALKQIALAYKDVHIVYPVHLNPNVQEPVYQLLSDVSNITLLPPLDYLPLVNLMKRCYLILTDSGGIQEEAPSLGKPVLVLREQTERPEGVQAGTVKVVGTDQARIVTETARLLEDDTEYKSMAQAINPYGDGMAAMRIVSTLLGRPWPATMTVSTHSKISVNNRVRNHTAYLVKTEANNATRPR